MDIKVKEGKKYKFKSGDGNTYYYIVVKINDDPYHPPELFIGLELYQVNDEKVNQDIQFLDYYTFLEIQDKFEEIE